MYLHVCSQMQSKLFSLQKPLISSEIVSAVIEANIQKATARIAMQLFKTKENFPHVRNGPHLLRLGDAWNKSANAWELVPLKIA